MDQIYTVDISNTTEKKEWVYEAKQCFDVSPRNTVCFTREAKQSGKWSFSVVHEVVVYDIDKPWETHQVMTSIPVINNVQWDRRGTRLLITDLEGTCQIWQMKDYMLNSWTRVCTASIPGEEILAVLWFHPGVQVLFNPEKRDTTYYHDKFQRATFLPSVTHFGGKPLDGWIAITSTGIIGAHILDHEDQPLQITRGHLSSSHLRLALAAISHSDSGDFMVATSDGQLSSCVQCFQVSVKVSTTGSVAVQSKASASLYMKSQVDCGASESQKMMVTHIAFLNSETSDTLLLCCACQGYSCLEIWTLIEQNIPLNKLFHMNTMNETGYKVAKWMHKMTVAHPSYLTCIAGPKLAMSKNYMETHFCSYIGISYYDGTIKLLHRYTYHLLHSGSDAIKMTSPMASPVKKQKSSVHMTGLQQSGTGCALIALHDGKISTLRVFNVRDGGSLSINASYICLLLEYVIVTGKDWWDIILAIKQNFIDGISQKLSENFDKQNASMQDVVGLKLTALKVALYSSCPGGHQKAVDFHARLVLQGISDMFKSLLRPKSASEMPAEKLMALCLKSGDGNIDNIVMHLDLEDFLMDSRKRDIGAATLISLQPLIQWVADFTLHLLATLPLCQSYSSFPGSTLLANKPLLNNLRELLVMIRVWGKICPLCLPVFTTASNTDCLAHLFRLLTKTVQVYKEGSNNAECDDSLLDECCTLPSKIVIPSLNQSFRLDEMGYTVLAMHLPQFFKSDEEPDFLYNRKKTKFPFLSDVLTEGEQNHDIIRQVHLGSTPNDLLRQCTRCGSYSLASVIGKSALMRAWEGRWKKNCVCCGHWKMVRTQ